MWVTIWGTQGEEPLRGAFCSWLQEASPERPREWTQTSPTTCGPHPTLQALSAGPQPWGGAWHGRRTWRGGAAGDPSSQGDVPSAAPPEKAGLTPSQGPSRQPTAPHIFSEAGVAHTTPSHAHGCCTMQHPQGHGRTLPTVTLPADLTGPSPVCVAL